jgi:hypothetical protein
VKGEENSEPGMPDLEMQFRAKHAKNAKETGQGSGAEEQEREFPIHDSVF